MIFDVFPTTFRLLLVSLFWHEGTLEAQTPRLSFLLRHQHAITNASNVIFSDVGPSQLLSHSLSIPADPYTYDVDTSRLLTHRPSSYAAFYDARLRSMRHGQSDATLWHSEEVLGPDVTDREALLSLAKMSNNAYVASPDGGWYNVEGFNRTIPVGWEPDDDGLRGHVFVSEDNSTVILSLKGTSAGWITGGGGPTVRKDKLNDNALFSCCCARVGPTWSPVCGCYKGSGKCSQECLESAVQDDDLYYSVGVKLYNDLAYMYPNSNIWIIGHSLGGSVSSLIGVTFGAPVVTFEPPAEKLAATRLHLPSPPSAQHITHIIHTADPIAMGTCNGVTSTCAIAGYAMETRCHLGKVALYDTVTKLKWAVDIRTHSIRDVIERILSEDVEWGDEPPADGDKSVSRMSWPWWGSGDKDKDKDTKKVKLPVPVAKEEVDCVDCFSWEYGEWE
ncbi:Alpha/Beta hydrolase protein [Boletus edulis BED1]|uniref:triacylglycerol lipase n=1 Tax=Boletus edulis BED1 TaxID=1328754 RepID=A0AAD4GDA8_BOLED|nr:Alpha/Beta hydrolase protein [Boletus edulis BED1]